jgi:hypothetical protein
MRFTPNDFDVRRRLASTSCRIKLGDSRTMPRNPKPPASVTAVTSSDRATPPIPANTTGYWHLSKSQAFVLKSEKSVGSAMSTGRCAVGWEYRTRVDRSPRPKFEVMCLDGSSPQYEDAKQYCYRANGAFRPKAGTPAISATPKRRLPSSIPG